VNFVSGTYVPNGYGGASYAVHHPETSWQEK
jgi:hypothetical protein